jgi:hypothetical protein
MENELEIEIELGGMVLVPPCDVIQCVNRVEDIEILFLDQYALLFVGMYRK